LPYQAQLNLGAINAVKPGVLDSYKYQEQIKIRADGTTDTVSKPVQAPVSTAEAYAYADQIRAHSGTG